MVEDQFSSKAQKFSSKQKLLGNFFIASSDRSVSSLTLDAGLSHRKGG